MDRFFHWVLFFDFFQVLPHRPMNLSGFRQLFAWNPTFLRRVRFHESAIHR
jgi:hypothetical protein